MLVTIGETHISRDESARGERPRNEEFFLRERFGVVHSMNDWKPAKTGSTRWQILFACRVAFSLVRMKKKQKPSVVYCTEEFPGLYLVVLLMIVCRNIPVVLLIHNVSSRKRQLFLKNRWCRERISRVLCLSKSSAKILAEDVGVRPDRLDIIGSRVDCEFFAPVPECEPALIVSAGAINRDYDTLIEACAPLNVHLAIAADTAWKHSLDKVPEAVSGKKLEMRSYGNYRNLRDLYKRATMVVVPLIEGEFASGQTVILEAMAMGKAVITTNIAGRSDFIDDGVTGVYVPSHDVEALRTEIESFLNDTHRRELVGKAGRSSVEANYTVQDYAARIIKGCELAAR